MSSHRPIMVGSTGRRNPTIGSRRQVSGPRHGRHRSALRRPEQAREGRVRRRAL